jgi:hypothetical protein
VKNPLEYDFPRHPLAKQTIYSNRIPNISGVGFLHSKNSDFPTLKDPKPVVANLTHSKNLRRTS